MKKLLLLLLLISGHLHAQEFFLGIKGGANFSNINNDKNNHMKLGFHAGGYFGAKFTEKLGGTIELLYSQKGTHHYIDRPPFRDEEVMVYIDYIDVPLVFNYYFAPWISADIGININTPVRGIRRYPNPGKPDEDFLPLIYKNVVSMPIGISIYGGRIFYLGLRGDIGLSPIGGDMRKNNVLMISVGFNLLRKPLNLNIGKSKK